MLEIKKAGLRRSAIKPKVLSSTGRLAAQSPVLRLHKPKANRIKGFPVSIESRTAVGKAIMAFLPEDKVEVSAEKHGFHQLTRKTISSMLELKAELNKVRKQGYALDDEEHEEGVICVGAPIWGFAPQPIGAISVSGPTFRLSPEKIPAVTHSVMMIANALSQQLGMRSSPPALADDVARDRRVHVLGA